MKKFMSFALTCMLSAALLVGCGGKAPASQVNEDGTVSIDKLNVYFVPSREPEEIVTATEPLKEMLKAQLKNEGYDVNEVAISVGTTFEAVGEALSAGTADIGFVPGGTYVLYDDGADVILTATRDGLSIDSDNAKDWNDNKPTQGTEEQATSYRSLLITGPSEKGQALAAKVNAGEALTWDDINSISWSVMSSSSPAGYIYPALVLQQQFGKGVTDLTSAVQSDSYGSAFARLASGQIDGMFTYADARRDYEDKWTSEFNRTSSIWDETNVVGVTAPIYNDTICVSKNSDVMDEKLQAAIQNAFINIGNTEEGKAIIAIYTHNGYEKATSADYDDERAAQKLIRELNAAK